MKRIVSHQGRVAAAFMLWLAATAAFAMEAAKLQSNLEGGEPITVIDIRGTTVFQRGHIAGAINIPAALVPEKRLPRLGWVVVCDDGLGRDLAAAKAVAELNKKPGIAAEVLVGGYAAWEALRGATTKQPGLHPEELNLISYDQLQKTQREDLVLVDLRKPRPQVRQAAGTGPELPPLTDLNMAFPGAAVTKSPFNLPQTRQSTTGEPLPPPVMVLIDDGDGAAQETARMLKANGLMRVVILAGGETILVRGGQPGLLRSGGQPLPVSDGTGAK